MESMLTSQQMFMRAAADSDPNVSASKHDKDRSDEEVADLNNIDGTITTAAHNGLSTDPSVIAQLDDWHRQRGKKILDAKKLLPHDGFFNNRGDRATRSCQLVCTVV